MVSYTALVGSMCVVVLTLALEDFDLPVIHSYWYAYAEDSLRLFEYLTRVVV